jgi:hypothetical protein
MNTQCDLKLENGASWQRNLGKGAIRLLASWERLFGPFYELSVSAVKNENLTLLGSKIIEHNSNWLINLN